MILARDVFLSLTPPESSMNDFFQFIGLPSLNISKQILIILCLKWLCANLAGIRKAFIIEAIQKDTARKTSRETLTF